jgi:hypothetical protein
MDPISQARLDTLRASDPNTWTEADAGFIRARASYLTADETVKYAAILRGVTVEDAAAQEPAEEKAAKKAK